MLFKNAYWTILIRLISASATLLSIPILLNMLGVDNYGTWAALTSVISWIMLFDFGAGVTVKNSVSRSLANEELETVRTEIIQTVRFLSMISMVALCLFFLSLFYFPFLRANWSVAIVLVVPFIIIFPITVGSMILQGARKFIKNSVIALIPQVFFVAFVLVFYVSEIKLEMISLAIFYASLNAGSIIFIWYSARQEVGLHDVLRRLGLGGAMFLPRLKIALRFFILQLSGIFLYSMGTVLTIDNLSSADAAQYDVVNKVYMFGMTLFNVVVSVFWAEIVFLIERRSRKKLMRLYIIFFTLALLFSMCVFCFSIISPDLINWWTDGRIDVDSSTTLFFAAMLSIQAITYCGATVMNSFEDLNFQIVLSGLAVVLMIPLSSYLFSINFDIVSVPIASLLISIPGLFYCNYKAISLIRGLSDA
ncbi:oligosaccharide flippase family protein [Rheinheimera tangshanensis]|uniref:Oligosaccharide flippase family protein n=1 Tax=Rheinheimera tangshanensis TaxID=400153 RepID=A0A5C8LVX2_9GAMM|nr:oligosaccharide flippase family protein [Rheinheimera tangshanensis]